MRRSAIPYAVLHALSREIIDVRVAVDLPFLSARSILDGYTYRARNQMGTPTVYTKYEIA